MIKINKELIAKIIEYKKLGDYLAVVVDYKGEENLVDMLNEITMEIEISFKGVLCHNPELLINVISPEDEAVEMYLYHYEDVMEELYPDVSQKNRLLHSAFHWIPSNDKMNWILLNVLGDNKYYNYIDRVNYEYLITTKKLNLI